MYRTVFLLAALAAVTVATPADERLEQARAHFQAVPAAVVEDPALVELGQRLYFEPRLSAPRRVSCNSCHNLALGGDDDRETAAGHGWAKTGRNVPTVLNAVFNSAPFWDGRAAELKAQGQEPVRSGLEMSNRPAAMVAVLRGIPGYRALFARAFPEAGEPLNFENLVRAIDAFTATLTTPGAPFDRYLAGETEALNGVQRRGLALFLDKGCVSCHAGINLGGDGYYPFGVVEKPGSELLPPQDKGRFEVTRTATDEYVFRSPGLRNVALTAPYFHSGRVWDLEQAVAIMGTSQLGKPLSPEDAKTITAFLHALNGTLPRVELPALPPPGRGSP